VPFASATSFFGLSRLRTPSPNNLGASTAVIAQLRAPGRGRRRRDLRLSATLCDAATILSRL